MHTLSGKASTRAVTPRGVKNIVLWILQAFVALAFLMAGLPKISNPAMADVFPNIAGGLWFRYLIGCIEVVSSVLVLIPRLATIGAGIVVFSIAGAVFAHLTVFHSAPVAPIILGVLGAVILFGRQSREIVVI